MDIPILNKEDVENQETEKSAGEENIRDQMIEFMKSKGYKHSPAEDGSGDNPENETSDFFTKGTNLIEVIITGGIDEEVLEQMISGIV